MRNIALLAIGCVVGCGAAAADDVDRLATLLEGRFDTHAANPGLPASDRLVDSRVRFSLPWLGEHVFYQQINHREEQSVYRQRVLVLSLADDGTLVQVAYALKNAAEYTGASVAELEGITADDLEQFMPDGCEQVFSPTEDGFHGHVDPARCIITSSRTGRLRGIGAESVLTETTLRLAERGFDPDTGEQLFGTGPGEYIELTRVD